MKITAVVRTNNRKEFLKECLCSISIQTHEDWEILIFDDGENELNYSIFREFRQHHPDKRIVYITSVTPFDFFKKSWTYPALLSEGDVIFRIDDDDLLLPYSFETISNIYEKNPSLDFSFGSSATFCNETQNILSTFYNQMPSEHKTRNAWSRYLYPGTGDYMWWIGHYPEEIGYTSIVHASRANVMTVYHPYVMRKKSLLGLGEIEIPTSNIFDDLEFLSTLEYRNLTYTTLKKVLIFVRSHVEIRRISQSDVSDRINPFEEITRVRDLCDLIRPEDFNTSTLLIEEEDSTEIDLKYILDQTKKGIEDKISQIFKN
jgi:glycosyltransferase involved in cell wall biosynthesis